MLDAGKEVQSSEGRNSAVINTESVPQLLKTLVLATTGDTQNIEAFC
jgi:hypothetical protein